MTTIMVVTSAVMTSVIYKKWIDVMVIGAGIRSNMVISVRSVRVAFAVS